MVTLRHLAILAAIGLLTGAAFGACADPPCTDTLTCEPASGGSSADGGSSSQTGGGGSGGEAGSGGANCGDTQSDALNCGSCGHDCLGGTCLAGECQPVELYAGLPGALLAVDGQSVYFFSNSMTNASVGRVPIDGGMFEGFDSGLSGPAGLAANGTHLFYAASVAEMMGRVWRADLTSTTTGIAITNMVAPSNVVVDATHVYVGDRGRGGVFRAPLSANNNDGGEQVLFALGDPVSLALHETNLYVADATAGRVIRAVTNGGASANVVTNLTQPLAVRANADWVCWIDDYAALQCRGVGGGAVVDVGTGSINNDFALDGDWLYWTDTAGVTTLRATLITNPAVSVVIAEMLDQFGGVSFDSEAIYWAAPYISKLAKPIELTGN